MTCDTHIHFFSPSFFAGLAEQLSALDHREYASTDLPLRLAWDDPESVESLADRWVQELSTHNVARAAMIASLPSDAPAVAAALSRHPTRFVGFFMVDPTRDNAVEYISRSVENGLRAVCLFPAMHRFSAHDEGVIRIFEFVSACIPTPAVFVHCGTLTIGVRRRLGLPSAFDMRFGNPLDLHGVAQRFPNVPILIPHFGAGMLREALMLADVCPNVYLDTSSTNGWMRYTPGLTLEQVFETALTTIGPDRLIFGTDSSFFPRGWNREVFTRQRSALDTVGASLDAQAQIFGGNFNRLFPLA
ncbi:MAG: amidohydrolase family protein [Vicinamibacterales bacterium]